VIFGDGAGAVCLQGVETDESVGVLASALHADGAFAESLMVEAEGSRFKPRISNELIGERRHFPTMDGKTIFKLAVQKLPEVVNEALGKAELALDDIDLFIPHQANLRINQFFQKSMKLPEEKVFNNIQRYGNTTAASIPIALDEAIEMNLIGDGNTVLFLGLGSGLTWGAVISRLVK
jgi:3-oxoacyl-[acyl-carrier-protein] synthase-3